jgi:septal ring factor EnvC (AmiA/AmiB activator)
MKFISVLSLFLVLCLPVIGGSEEPTPQTVADKIAQARADLIVFQIQQLRADTQTQLADLTTSQNGLAAVVTAQQAQLQNLQSDITVVKTDLKEIKNILANQGTVIQPAVVDVWGRTTAPSGTVVGVQSITSAGACANGSCSTSGRQGILGGRLRR